MISPTLERERQLWSQGYTAVAGVDEVGRGAWAGPVVAAAVVFPTNCVLATELKTGPTLPALLRDSKKLSACQRLGMVDQLKQICLAWSIGQVSVAKINQVGIGKATFLAMQSALDSLLYPYDFVLIDGFIHPDLPKAQQQAVIKGDATVASISAASIIAKVYRDQLITQMDKDYPQYGLAQHKGYGTSMHQQAIAKHGLSPMHRTSFKLKFLDNL